MQERLRMSQLFSKARHSDPTGSGRAERTRGAALAFPGRSIKDTIMRAVRGNISVPAQELPVARRAGAAPGVGLIGPEA